MIEISFQNNDGTVSSMLINTFNITTAVIADDGKTLVLCFVGGRNVQFNNDELLDTTCKEIYLAIKGAMI